MNTDQLHPLVKAAVDAMNAGDRDGWFALFGHNSTLTDDGSTRDFSSWSDNEFFSKGKTYLKTIDRVEDKGLTLYGTLHSDRWGEFATFMKFQIRDNKITHIDFGQV